MVIVVVLVEDIWLLFGLCELVVCWLLYEYVYFGI